MWTIQCAPSYVFSVNFSAFDRQSFGALRPCSSVCSPSEEFCRKRLSLSSNNKSRSRMVINAGGEKFSGTQRTCRNCKQPFDPEKNHPRACLFHTAHFGGETKRKFESVYTGGTMETIGGGEIVEYWHCCGSEDRFDPGCEAAPHASYDD